MMHAPLAVLERIERDHSERRMGDAAEGADQVDLDRQLELLRADRISRALVSLSRPTVLAALATPAQLTSTRSWPWASRALAKAAATFSSRRDVDFAENAADLAATCLALVGIAVEHRDLGPAPRQLARGRLAEARSAARHHRGNSLDVHAVPSVQRDRRAQAVSRHCHKVAATSTGEIHIRRIPPLDRG